MFADFLRRLANPSAPLPRFDARLALAALLVRVARADGSYDSREQALIDQVLQAHHALTPPQAQTLRTEAEALESEAPDTVRFTREIKDAVPHEDREWRNARKGNRRSHRQQQPDAHRDPATRP